MSISINNGSIVTAMSFATGCQPQHQRHHAHVPTHPVNAYLQAIFNSQSLKFSQRGLICPNLVFRILMPTLKAT